MFVHPSSARVSREVFGSEATDGSAVAVRAGSGATEQNRLPVDEHRNGTKWSETRRRLGRFEARCCRGVFVNAVNEGSSELASDGAVAVSPRLRQKLAFSVVSVHF